MPARQDSAPHHQCAAAVRKSTTRFGGVPGLDLGHHPPAQIICVSYAQDFADKLARDCTSVVERLVQRTFRPECLANGGRREFVTTTRGFRLATSVGGVITGRGADFIIIDDPLKPAEALVGIAPQVRQRLVRQLALQPAQRQVAPCIIMIMQRVHKDDLVGHVLGAGRMERALTPGDRRRRRRVRDRNPVRSPEDPSARWRAAASRTRAAQVIEGIRKRSANTTSRASTSRVRRRPEADW